MTGIFRDRAIDGTWIDSNLELTTLFPKPNEPARQTRDERRPVIEAVSG